MHQFLNSGILTKLAKDFPDVLKNAKVSATSVSSSVKVYSLITHQFYLPRISCTEKKEQNLTETWFLNELV